MSDFRAKGNHFVFILTAITLASVLSDIFLFTYDGSSLIEIIKKAKIILIPSHRELFEGNFLCSFKAE